jgi:hypothetical protein
VDFVEIIVLAFVFFFVFLVVFSQGFDFSGEGENVVLMLFYFDDVVVFFGFYFDLFFVFLDDFLGEFFDFCLEGEYFLIFLFEEVLFVAEVHAEFDDFVFLFFDDFLSFLEVLFPLFVVDFVLVDLFGEFGFEVVDLLVEVCDLFLEVGDVVLFLTHFGQLVFLFAPDLVDLFLELIYFFLEACLLLLDVLLVLGFVFFDFHLVVLLFEDESFDEGPVDFVVGVECRDQLLDLLFIY